MIIFFPVIAGGALSGFFGMILFFVLIFMVWWFIIKYIFYPLLKWLILSLYRAIPAKYKKQLKNEISQIIIPLPSFMTPKKQIYLFLIMLLFGAVGFVLALFIVFLLIPLGLPDIVLKWICILLAIISAVYFAIRSLHYFCPEYLNWAKDQCFSKKRDGNVKSSDGIE